MGSSNYSVSSRSLRSEKLSYATNTVADNFTQSKVRMIHESMEPKQAKLREARDSATHPNTVPIILALDLTGSMGSIPQNLVIEGLPKMMAGIIEHGIPDPALLFMGVGDTSCDRFPLQVGQFESGDLELDTWLTRTYLEGGGGGNEGESYLLAWYYAAFHTQTDAWDKRKQKGFLFTCGDEPSLSTLPARVIAELMGQGQQKGYTDKELLDLAREKWIVKHLHISETGAGARSSGYWKELLGEDCIIVADHREVATIIANTVTAIAPKTAPVSGVKTETNEKPTEEIYL